MIEMIFLLCLFLCDNVLTHYQKFLLEKKGCWTDKLEQNRIIRLFINRFSIGVSIILAFLWQSALVFVLFVITAMMNVPMSGFLLLITGMIGVVLMYHLIYIGRYQELWNNKEYWDLNRKISKLL